MTRILSNAFMAMTAFGLVSAANADESTFQATNIVDFDTGVVLDGAATLRRTKNEIWARVYTTGLDEDAGYTVWWVIFNNPEKCSDDCGENDLGNKNVLPAVLYATGFVTDDNGIANVTAHLTAGDISAGVDFFDDLYDGQSEFGLADKNGLGAEVHLVVRTHGRLVTGLVDEQISTFNGACDLPPDDDDDDDDDDDNDEEERCDDQQAAVFPAP